jgi:quercetin dioxygenase-like cupin family protein
MEDGIVTSRTRGSYDLGVAGFRILASSADTQGSFSLLEFEGKEGQWTVPHMHRNMEESFFVLDGGFTFTLNDKEFEAGPGDFLLVPRGTKHVLRAGAEGGRLLTLVVPGGLEEMFKELSALPADSITDPEVRMAISAKYDSVPA